MTATTTYKVKLMPFPSAKLGTYGMAATVEGLKRSDFLASAGTFNTLTELRTACEKAQIPALVMGMPTPGRVYELTRAQLATLGFQLKASV